MIHEMLQRVFEHFQAYDCVIVGSATVDVEAAHDIDVLFTQPTQWKGLMKALGVTYNGWNSPLGHIRRARYRIPGIDKPIHLLSCSRPWPHRYLLPNGTLVQPEKEWRKPPPTKEDSDDRPCRSWRIAE